MVEQDGFISNPGGPGIFATGNGVTVDNAGSVTGGPQGIFVLGDSTITNSGEARGFFAIYAFGNDSTITNSGEADGGSFGIFAVGDGNTITNSGNIIGGASAVLFDGGGDNTLELLAGSNIQGSLELGGSSNTLIIGRGLDTALTFTGSCLPSRPMTFLSW